MMPKGDGDIVVIKEGEDKLHILDDAVKEAGLFRFLEAGLKKSGRKRDEFLIAVKPNFMVLTSAADRSNYTDTEMVIHLLKRFYDLGFRNLFVVESENVLGQWYRNRSVPFVAKVAGYREEFYRIDSITENAVPYKYDGILRDHFVGRTWKEADFRISFAKNKTHPAGTYTLTLKNIFGVTVKQNKYLDYHKHLEWDLCVVDMLDAFPVHFGIVDAFISADGPFGFRGSNRPKKTKTVLAGQNCIAVDWVGAMKMGLNPMRSRLMRKVVDRWGMPSYTTSGNAAPYEGWNNPPRFLPHFDDMLEEWYSAHSFFTHCTMLPPDDVFPEVGAPFFRFIRHVLGLKYSE
jgi:uncharacterized protein (DUF362 family)